MKYIAIVKEPHKYIFSYKSGDESKVLRAAIDYAKDPSSTIDWHDIVLLTRKLREILLQEMAT